METMESTPEITIYVDRFALHTDYIDADLWAFAGNSFEADILSELGFVYQGESFDTGRKELGASYHKKVNRPATVASA